MSKHSYEIDWTQPQTTSQGINYTQGLMQVNQASQGWQCPICKRVLAPFVPECPCGGQGMKTWTTTSTEGAGKTITMNYLDDFDKQEHHCYCCKPKHLKKEK